MSAIEIRPDEIQQTCDDLTQLRERLVKEIETMTAKVAALDARIAAWNNRAVSISPDSQKSKRIPRGEIGNRVLGIIATAPSTGISLGDLEKATGYKPTSVRSFLGKALKVGRVKNVSGMWSLVTSAMPQPDHSPLRKIG